MPVTEVRNVVQQTDDYDQFSFLSTNRDQNRGHIEALKEAFEEMGNFTKVQPILVNDQYQIIDGQHRFTACKELGLPIYFTVVDGLGVREARNMNILHRGWRVEDFARSYAMEGNTNYQKYLVLKEDYGFSHSILLAYIYGKVDRAGVYKTFREGNFVFDNEKEVRERLNMLSQYGEHTNLVNNREFAFAVLRIMDSENYEHKRMLNKLAQNGHSLVRMGTIDDNLRQLEELYNYNSKETARKRLF